MDIEEIDFILLNYEENLNKAITHLESELTQIRTGRANPKILEKIMVDYYGNMTPINQMATISVPEARMLMISVWDISALRNVSKAIEAANLGVNPSDDGRVIRLNFPALTLERRKDLVKDVGKLVESCKVICRNERRDTLESFKKLKKDNNISEDEYERLEKDVQKTLDLHISKIDVLFDKKQKDILEI